jgi:hypothetical protein
MVGEDVTLRVDLTRVDFGRIQVTANVAGALVFVDDRQVGTVPYAGDHVAGPHRVRVESDDMKEWEEQVNVRNGQLTPIQVQLRPSVDRGGAWLTTTLGALVLGGGIVAGVFANNLERDLNLENGAGTLADNDPRVTQGTVLSIVADAAFAASAVLGAIAIYEFLKDPLDDSSARVREPRDWAFAPRVSDDGAGATVTVSF